MITWSHDGTAAGPSTKYQLHSVYIIIIIAKHVPGDNNLSWHWIINPPCIGEEIMCDAVMWYCGQAKLCIYET